MQINLLTRNDPRLLPMPRAMAKIDNQKDWNTNIRSEERRSGETAGEEDVESVDQGEDYESHHGDPGSHWLQEGVVWYQLPVERLYLVGFAEAQVDDAAADPGDEAGGVGEVNEPTEDHRPAIRAVEVSER